MEAQGIVCNPQRQREGKEDVRNDQVERVQGGGVDLLQIGPDDVEGETVAEQSHKEHDAVEKRHDDPGIVPVGVQGVTGKIGVIVGGGGGHGHSGRTHHDSGGTSNCEKEKRICE